MFVSVPGNNVSASHLHSRLYIFANSLYFLMGFGVIHCSFSISEYDHLITCVLYCMYKHTVGMFGKREHSKCLFCYFCLSFKSNFVPNMTHSNFSWKQLGKELWLASSWQTTCWTVGILTPGKFGRSRKSWGRRLVLALWGFVLSIHSRQGGSEKELEKDKACPSSSLIAKYVVCLLLPCLV